MNNTNLIRAFLLLSALVACGAARAKTVALWPLDVDSNKIGLRCAVDPRNDLLTKSHYSSTAMDAPWELPPNPDAGRHAFEPVSHSSVRETLSGSNLGFLYNDHSGVYLRRDMDFTVEGYIKVLSLPASNEWAYVVGAWGNDFTDGNKNRWVLSFRRRSTEDYACSWIIWGQGTSDTLLYRYADEAASYAITNTWIHVALAHEALSGGQDHWKLYLDGTFVGDSRNTGSYSEPNSSNTPRFELGARLKQNGNHIDAVFDYWRISDKVLESSEFLCAGEGGTSVTACPTVSYWPLGVTSDGGIDCRDAVGVSPLTGGFYGAKFAANRMTPVEDCAFTGNPPNSTVTLPNGNAGAFLGSATAACLQNDAVGAFLNVTSNFTVEGWFCPRICERPTKISTGEACCYLLGNRIEANTTGWVLQHRAKGTNQFQFDLYCWDGSGVLRNNVIFEGAFDMNTWYDTWRHVALTYNATGGSNGFGLWTLYIDGVKFGELGNPRAPVAITESRSFNLGGRAKVANNSFQGKIDCVRVCATVLSPNQFLNVTNNPAAATDVVGFWPLNVENGAYLDLRDVSGKNNHFAARDSNYAKTLATADPDTAPTIPNPDKTPTFRGDPSKVNGSVRFGNPDVSPVNERATLMTGSSDALQAVAGGKNFTFECYYRRRRSTASISDYKQMFFAQANGTTIKIGFFRNTNGFYIWENWNTTSELKDTLIPDTADSNLEYDHWYHVALVHTIEPVNDVSSSMWRIYLDGHLKGSANKPYNGSTASCGTLCVGGRYWYDKNTVIGNLSSVRLSNRALDPSEFLCATPAASAKPEPTVGYWPIDSIQPGLANLADEEYPLVADGTAAGQAEPARLSIPNKNALTNVVTGAARQNHGSYALGTGGTLAAASIGFEMAGPKSFTVEGWLKWTPAEGTADEDLITVGDALTGNGGLRIFFDKTGETPKLRVFARGAWPCTPYVDGAFDADLTSLVGTWAHVAIAYDISDGEGTWTLYIEGKQVGQVKNFYHPTSIDYSRGGDFTLGSAAHPLSAAVDMWRVSTVAYASEDLLYAPPGGMTILFR